MLRTIANTADLLSILRPSPKPRHNEIWQSCMSGQLTIPRCSITGQLLWGTVLRRRDTDRWIYKNI